MSPRGRLLAVSFAHRPAVQHPVESAVNHALTNAATSVGSTEPFPSKSPASVAPCRLVNQVLMNVATSAGVTAPSPSVSAGHGGAPTAPVIANAISRFTLKGSPSSTIPSSDQPPPA